MQRLVALCLLVVSAQGNAAITATLIDLPLPGSPRILDVRPDNAIATLVTIPGGLGVYDIVSNAVPTSQGGRCGMVPRNAYAFAANRIAVVLVDRLNYDHAPILEWLWNRDRLPVWPSGASASTQAAIDAAAAIEPQVPSGVVLASPVGGPSHAAEVTGPALVIYHVGDALSNADASGVYNGFANASVRQIVAFSGGSDADCNGPHLLWGLDAEFVATVTTFVTNNNPTVPASGAAAVEYFNAGFGHYFMSADADEIGGLDGGAYGGAFVRTGKTFKVLDAPGAGTAPVCRFFTTPGTFGTKSSHFYTADPVECEGLKLNPNWVYEKIAFHIGVPVDGVCPAGTTPVYRMYNHGQTGAPNHRVTTDPAIHQQMTMMMGWDEEGIRFCAPA
jgi:hypothetical protein